MAAQSQATKSQPNAEVPTPKSNAVQNSPKKTSAKLSYKEQRELDSLPEVMGQLEEEQKKLNEELADPSLFIKDAQAAADKLKRVDQIETLLIEHLQRWEELSER